MLIRGESGTGKELVARADPRQQRRAATTPLVPVNCGALAETLLESELFGHEKGAFTGAQYRDASGKLRGGRTAAPLFLDEIGDISLKTPDRAAARAAESASSTRVGGNEAITVDFRFICATNHDLEELVARGPLPRRTSTTG